MSKESVPYYPAASTRGSGGCNNNGNMPDNGQNAIQVLCSVSELQTLLRYVSYVDVRKRTWSLEKEV